MTWLSNYGRRRIHGTKGERCTRCRAGKRSGDRKIWRRKECAHPGEVQNRPGPGGSMVTMARACLYSLNENKKIKEKRDEFLVLSQ